MTATARSPKAKPARTLKVLSRLTDRVAVVRVTEGKRVDVYTVSASDGAIWWSHTDSSDRRYRVDCGPGGAPTSCDCPSRVPCRHLLASITLIARGDLLPPEVEVDERESVSDYRETAEEVGAWYDRGPDRLADDEHADAIGRRIVQEMGGC
jgi:hypothetical protein